MDARVRKGEHLERRLAQGLIARGACRRLEPLAFLRPPHAPHRERHAEAFAKLPAKARPAVGVWAQAMMDMHRRDRGALCQRVQEHNGVHATGKTDDDTLALQPLERTPCGGDELSAPGLP